jgi:cation diffusion facilitator CzcD-associated flavoprotein CzcO
VFQPRLLKGMELLGRAHLRRQVHDPKLRAKLTPQYSFGCKRPTFSNAYYPALSKPNVSVVTEGIREVTSRGIVTADGVEHELDTIIFGTGFRVTDNPAFGMIRGRDGRTLADDWAGGTMRAYLGTTITNCPNLFMLLGPNSVVYTSQVVTIEAQVGYVMSALEAMDEHGLASIEVRPEAQQSFVEATDDRLAGSVWNAGGCSSYYLTDGGRNYTFWPGFVRTFKRRTSAVDLADYITRSARAGLASSGKARTA